MKLIAAAISLLLVVGCASVGRKLDPNKVSQIKQGETTRAEVLKLVGSPDQILNVNGELTYSYMHVYAQANGASFIPVVGAFAGGATTQNQFLRLTFDKDDRVSTIVSSYGQTEAGSNLNANGGASLQEVQAGKRSK